MCSLASSQPGNMRAAEWLCCCVLRAACVLEVTWMLQCAVLLPAPEPFEMCWLWQAAAVVAIGGGFVALSKLDSGFSEFITGSVVKVRHIATPNPDSKALPHSFLY